MNRYQRIAEHIFLEGHRSRTQEVPFGREDLAAAADQLRLARPKNLGDMVCAPRYRCLILYGHTATFLPIAVSAPGPSNRWR